MYITFNESNKKFDFVATFAMVLLFVFSLFRLYDLTDVIQTNILYFVLGVSSLIYSIIKNTLKKQSFFIIFIMFYSLAGITTMLYNGNSNMQEILWPFSFMSIGLLLLNFNLSYKIIRWLYYVLTLILLVNYSSINSISLHHINSISTYTLLFLGIYVIVSRKNNINLSLFPYILALCISILTVGRSTGGRGGVLSFLILIVAYFLKYIKNFKKLIGYFLIMMIISSSILFLYPTFSKEVNFVKKIEISINNFKKRGLKSERITLWKDYIEKTRTTFFNIIFGSSISGTRTLDRFSENLHNSFLMLHAKYGVFLFILVIFLIVKSTAFLINCKQYEMLCLFLALFLRMNIDYTNFNSILDILLIYYLLIPHYTKKPRSNYKIYTVNMQDNKCISP